MDAELAIRCFLASDLFGMVNALRPEYIEQVAMPDGAMLTAAVFDTAVVGFGPAQGTMTVHVHDTHQKARQCAIRCVAEVRELLTTLTEVTTPVSYGNGGYV